MLIVAPDSLSGYLVVLFAVLAVVPFVAAVVATVEATARAVRAGPTFAADASGVWIGPLHRKRVALAPPLFVPWESVDRISPGRRLFGRVVTVRVRAEGVEWLKAEASQLLFGPGLSVVTSYEFGVSQDEALEALRELAAGRATIAWRR
ncbi:hypothetical protein GCM10009539_25100 [Cryptosporangium japonicum]|uniref:Uncharacterized protein n=1 Tax=Cryptosporangium japonicum TaxID=80872 RepID=A0ABP3DPR7_9ACTN